MDIETLYKEVIMEHHRNPAGRAPLARVDAQARGFNASCGDEYVVRLQIEGDTVTGVQVDGHGCAISSAAGSMLAQAAVGRTVDEVRELIARYRRMVQTGEVDPSLPGDLPALAGVSRFPVRVKCATLAMTTALDALEHGAPPA